MIMVFNAFPISLGLVAATITPVNSRAATAAAEAANAIEWLIQVDC
jgi:hypothetical protein